jgi:hypothetical protein
MVIFQREHKNTFSRQLLQVVNYQINQLFKRRFIDHIF